MHSFCRELVIFVSYSLCLYQKFVHKERMDYNSPNSLILWAKEGCNNISFHSLTKWANLDYCNSFALFPQIFDTDYMRYAQEEISTFPVWNSSHTSNATIVNEFWWRIVMNYNFVLLLLLAFKKTIVLNFSSLSFII